MHTSFSLSNCKGQIKLYSICSMAFLVEGVALNIVNEVVTSFPSLSIVNSILLVGGDIFY